MARSVKLFKAMFKAEIEESLELAHRLEKLYYHRFQNDEISNYVYIGNKSFLINEIFALKKLLNFLDKVKLSKFKTPEELAIHLRDVVKKKVKEFEDPEAIYVIVKRKIKKILSYMNMKSQA